MSVQTAQPLTTRHSQFMVKPLYIQFRNTAADRVAITVVVDNPSQTWSPPTQMVVHAAPLGAFVPWRFLTSVAIPPVEPWSHHAVTTQVTSPRTSPLGDVDEVTAQDLIAVLRRPRRAAELGGQDRIPQGLPVLPDDPLALVGRPNPYWAGNLNVFIGCQAVECHRAQALRIYPGRENLALFLVGSGTDAYAFHAEGPAANWQMKLEAMTMGSLLSPGGRIHSHDWIDGRHVRLVRLSICPPEKCRSGQLDIHVTQRSTQKEAVIEFSLDPQAAGPGCFTR